MPKEIERKFLVRDDSWRKHAGASEHYRQGYLGGSPACSVRVRVSGDRAWLSVKGRTEGVTRQEYEYGIPARDAEEILETLAEGRLIEKDRYIVEHEGHTWEIDEFLGENAGLIVAEIELSDPDEPFARPEWLGAEVSHDARYYNANLTNHPYATWDKQTPAS